MLPFIEAAINAHNDGGYALAIENYNNAYNAWKENVELSPSLELYF